MDSSKKTYSEQQFFVLPSIVAHSPARFMYIT